MSVIEVEQSTTPRAEAAYAKYVAEKRKADRKEQALETLCSLNHAGYVAAREAERIRKRIEKASSSGRAF